MISTLYIERDIAQHPRAASIAARFPKARQVLIDRYGDVFNQAAQNFRQQKQHPALILAKKHGRCVLPTPPNYHIGGTRNYYFSHMLNCVYDCRYCFLQGMYRSGNYVVFANFDDFFCDIRRISEEASEPAWFFSGYDCDSLALNPITQFTDQALDEFAQLPNAHLELRTKSTQIRTLLNREPLANVVVAYSLSPEAIVSAEEHRTPSLKKRIQALQELQQAGWKVGLRFDPVLYSENYQTLYSEMFQQAFAKLNIDIIHSVSLGAFRLPKPFYKRMVKLYPDSKLLAQPMSTSSAMVSYPHNLESEMMSYCEADLMQYIQPHQYFPCVSISEPTKQTAEALSQQVKPVHRDSLDSVHTSRSIVNSFPAMSAVKSTAPSLAPVTTLVPRRSRPNR